MKGGNKIDATIALKMYSNDSLFKEKSVIFFTCFMHLPGLQWLIFININLWPTLRQHLTFTVTFLDTLSQNDHEFKIHFTNVKALNKYNKN